MQRSKGVIAVLMLAGVPVAISLLVTLALLPIMYLGLPLVVLLLMGLPVALLMQIGLRLTLIGGLVRGGQTHAAADIDDAAGTPPAVRTACQTARCIGARKPPGSSSSTSSGTMASGY